MPLTVSAVQFEHRALAHFDEFAEQVEGHVRFAASFGSRLVCFPEYMTVSLLTIGGPGAGGADASDPRAWQRWTEPYLELMQRLARRYDVFILGGTHIVREGDRYFNTAFLFGPSGQVLTQRKLHLTPCEISPWHLGTGDAIQVFETPVGSLAILVCFDIEFPEAARAAVDAGAQILLCPSATDDRQGFHRVRYCALARAVENQVYVVHSALVGRLPKVRFFEQSYGRSAVISPCDVPFARDGIVVEGEWNQDLVVTGVIDLELLQKVRAAGSVTPRLVRRQSYSCAKVILGR